MIISFKNTTEIAQAVAQNLQQKRKWHKHSRAKAAELSGVPAPTIRRFEQTGEIAFRQLLMLVQVYGDTALFEQLFTLPKAKTMDELLARSQEKR